VLGTGATSGIGGRIAGHKAQADGGGAG